jgi:hypothetical protein
MPHTPDWMPEEELAALAAAPEPSTMTVRQAEAIAMEIFRDNLPLAAQVIAEIATNSESERNRLQASKYIVERVMGRTPDAKPESGANDPWSNLFSSVLREPTATERAEGATISRI